MSPRSEVNNIFMTLKSQTQLILGISTQQL